MTEKNNNDVPQQIGPYRILDVLGEGGMAVVYLAEQSEPIKRQVALKIVKLGMDTKRVVARFESERQALAVLDHPHIAKVFDGGVTDTGRPYFVMERVRGIPITDYCDQNKLSTRERVRLFADVCAAVQHAHHKGLIHRDLKPSNLLVGVVDGKPEVKIIDFGIAKATNTRFIEQTMFTKIGQIVGTPQYMSPEQAEITGLDVDTRTDIYSLGVVLYELLVGTLPLDLAAVGEHAIKAALQEREPPKPSTRITELGDTKEEIARARRTSPADLRRELKGDLDWVVMRAIEKDRTRRYETANALALECRRYLKNEPIVARPPSAGYVLQRFVRRNRVMVIAGAIALIAVIAGAVAATIGFVRATNAEQAALRDAETAQQVSGFLIELFEVSDPSEGRGNTITAREILDRGAERIQSELTTQPEVQAAMMGTMGRVYSTLGLYDAAQPLLDQALDITDAAIGDNSVEAAQVLYDLAELTRRQADFDRAVNLHRRGLALRRSLLPEGDPIIAASLQGLGLSLYFAAKYEEAEARLKQALDIYIASVGSESKQVALVYSDLGSVNSNMGRRNEAERLLNESLRISRALYGDLHPMVSGALNDLALIYRDDGRNEEAVRTFEEALSIHRQIYHAEHEFIAETQAHLAWTVGRQGEYDRAVALYKDSIKMLRRSVGREHMLTARVIDSLGVLHLVNTRYEAAEPLFTESVEIHRTLLGERHINTGRALNNMAASLLLNGEYAGAEPYFRESLSIRIEHLGEAHNDVANSRNNLADLLNNLGRFGEAEPLAAAAADNYGNNLGPDHWRAAVARNIHGRSLVGLGRFDEAELLIKDSLGIIAESVTGSVYHRTALQRAVDLYTEWDNPDAAMPFTDELACLDSETGC